MLAYPFSQVVASKAALREIIREPTELAVRKQLSALDDHCRVFIARSPFLLIGTADGAGRCDVSPRGDAPGFVLVLDDKTLVIPERTGNRRVDTLGNILENPHVGLLFLIPNVEETLRVNGRAAIVRDAEFLERTAVNGKCPLLAIAVEVQEVFVQCPKSLKRACLWDAARWPQRSELPSFARMLMDHARPAGCTLDELEQRLEASNQRLY